MIELNLQLLGGRGGKSGTGAAKKPDIREGGIKDTDITSRENYVLYRVIDDKELKFYGERSGKELRDKMADEFLRYDKRKRFFFSAQQKKYVIKRK